jgi:hypothetical protein
MNYFRERTVTPAQIVTKQIPTNTWRETACRLEMCRGTNEAHTEINCVYNKFGEVHCFNIHQFLIFRAGLPITKQET